MSRHDQPRRQRLSGRLLILLLVGQFLLFWRWYPQPIIYDAAQYVALSEQIHWVGPIPTLPADGLRTVAYPLLIRLLGGTGVILFQQGLFLALIVALRHRILDHGWVSDLCLAGLLIALPVLPPYSLALLADLPGAVLLQGGLIALAWGLFDRRGPAWSLAISGLAVGFAIQLRPPYAHQLWIALAVLLIGTIQTREWVTIRRRLIACGCWLACFLAVSTPTIVAHQQTSGRWSHLPGAGADEMLAYHLMLGLSLDRWSSNPPPFAERELVAERWRKRGWAILPIPPWRGPTLDEYFEEARREPARVARQAIRHTGHAFAKVDAFPYAGRFAPGWMLIIQGTNGLVILLGLWESVRRAGWGPMGPDRLFAILQLALFLDILVTCALVVPEERFTLALYPVWIVYAADRLRRFLPGHPRSPHHAPR